MNDFGYEFDAAAMAPACGPAEWASAAGIDGRLEAQEREPDADPGDGGCWRDSQPEPMRAWWATRGAVAAEVA